MISIIDFDSTILDTKKLDSYLADLFGLDSGSYRIITTEIFDKRKENFNVDVLLDELIVKKMVDKEKRPEIEKKIEDILQKIDFLVFPEMFELIEILKKKGKLILLTCGDSEWQGRKLANLSMGKLFDEIIIANSSEEKREVYERLKDEKDIIFINDNGQEVFDASHIFSNAKIFVVRGRHTDDAEHGFRVYEHNELLEAIKNDIREDFNMLLEIEEQPSVISALMISHMKDGIIEMPEFHEFKEKLKNVERFSFWGIGSSYHVAMYGNYLFEDICDIPCEAESADELIVRDNVLEHNTAVVVISQSGETSDLVTAVKRAKEKKVLTIGILNNTDSTLGSLVDVALNVRAGEEKALATTKAFTAQLFTLFLLANYYNQLQNKNNNKLLASAKTLPDKISEIIKIKENIKDLANKYLEAEMITVLGRHWHYPIALETALKLKETAYMPTEGMATETFRHGPEAIIDESFHSISYLPKDKNYEENLIATEEIIKAGGQVSVVANEKIEKVSDLILAPRIEACLQPIVSVVVGQYLAYYLAKARGLDIDHPRNIFKFIKK
jgi:glucosamine 6-phosphate synthetase-like amidotransferase/phosphosugar isomerase protein